jgi:polyisoprenoid-binding protein YceI
MLWIIDKDHSLLEFSTKHMMIATVRGRFTEFSVNADLIEDDLTDSTVEVIIQMDSLTTYNEARDAHLRSAEFLDVERYPTSTFRSTRIEREDGNHYRMYGDLVLKDVSRQINIRVTDEGKNKTPWGTELWGFGSHGSINRRDFGLNWNVALETGGWLVGDQVQIAAELELIAAPVAAGNEVAVPVA